MGDRVDDHLAVTRKPVGEILKSMQTEADVAYMGDLQRNVLEIFSRLSTMDKRTFLKTSVEVLWEKQIQDVSESLHRRQQLEIELDVNVSLAEVERLGIVVARKVALEKKRKRLATRTLFLLPFFIGVIAIYEISAALDSPSWVTVVRLVLFILAEIF